MTGMVIREIEEADLGPVHALLCEGFSRKSPDFWEAALQMLSARAEVEGYPRYGFMLEVEGAAQGVLLLLTARIGDQVRSNLSSWYVRKKHRTYATFLFQRSLRRKGGIYLNLSPSPVALPIATAFGFKPYTAGSLLIDPRAALQCADSKVRAFEEAGDAPLHGQDEHTQALVAAQMSYGCRGFIICDELGAFCGLYRIERFKRCPAARFVFGDPLRLARSAGPLIRALLRRGVPLLLLDIPETAKEIHNGLGKTLLAHRGRRYIKGAPAPDAGDLMETEISVFGP